MKEWIQMTTITGKFDGAHENRAAKEFVLMYEVDTATGEGKKTIYYETYR